MANAAFVKASNTTELTQAASWSTAGGPPLSTDVGSWALGAANNVAASANTFTPGAIYLKTGQTGAVTINQPVTLAGLTAVVDGLPIGTGITNSSTASLFIDRALTVSASQVWNMASGGVYFGFNNAAGTVSAASGTTITKKGTASAGFYRSNTLTGVTFDVEEGLLTYGNVANPFGSATLRLNSAGTGLSAGISPDAPTGITQTLSNPVSILGNSTLLFAFGGSVTSTMTLSGAVTISAANPTLTVGASTVTISGAITGTAGFTKSGAGTLTLTNTSNTVYGPVSVTFGVLLLGDNTVTGAGNFLPGTGGDVPAVAVSSGANVTVTSKNNVSIPNAFSGDGKVQLQTQSAAGWTSANSGFTFGAGQLAGLTGTAAPVANVPSSGLMVNATSSGASGTVSVVTVEDLPRYLNLFTNTGAAACQTYVKYTGALSGPQTCTVWPFALSTANLSTSVYKFSANQSALNPPLEISGGVTRGDTVGGTLTFRLGGTNATDNAISGPITAPTATLAVTKEDAGKWVLSGANTYTGITTVAGGTLSAQSVAAFGAAASAVTQTGGTIDVSGNTALNKAGGALTLISAAGATALSTTTGTNTLACAGITLSSTIIVAAAAGASLTVNNTAAMSGAFGITKNNSGEIGLGTFANTYTGAVTINAGTLTVGNLQNTSTASSLGTGALSSAIALTGTLKYNGTGHSTNRSITFTGSAPALDASGSGAVTYSACTQAAGARTITFTGSNTAANTLSAALSDGTGAVSVAKSGAGKWVLSNATVNYTGTTTVSAGTLNLGGANRTLSGTVSISDGTIENSTNTLSANVVMTGGTITAQLTGNKTLDVDSGIATLQPTNNVNDFSGATTIDAGATLRLITGLNPSLGSGRVLGTSNVDVSGNLRTDGSATQKGQMRYGGNLTFQAGAKLYVGSLA